MNLIIISKSMNAQLIQTYNLNPLLSVNLQIRPPTNLKDSLLSDLLKKAYAPESFRQKSYALIDLLAEHLKNESPPYPGTDR